MATVSSITSRIRTTLQDVTPKRWTNDEVDEYINEGLEDIATETKHTRTIETLSVVASTTVYDLNSKAIEFESIDTEQVYTLTSNQRITFTDPAIESVEVIYYAYPDAVDLATDQTLDLDNDLVTALRFYVLARCYEKEDLGENFQKAMYYENKYNKKIDKNSSRWQGDTEVTIHKNDFYK